MYSPIAGASGWSSPQEGKGVDKKGVIKIIEEAVGEEIKARDFYKSISAQLPDKGAQLKLDVMAKAEDEHRRILSAWYTKLAGKEYTPPTEKKEGYIKIEAPRRNARFLDIVKIIYEAEERAYQFYKDASDKAEDPEEKKTFLKLAQMEKGHEEHFREEYRTLAEDTSIRFADEEIPWMIEAME
ncbi:MAG: ferritin family protein [Candidatus Brocadiales bacterium]